MYESILAVYRSSLFHSFIIYGKKVFLKISVLHSAASLALHTENFVSATEKNVVPKFTNRLSWTLNKICKYKGFLKAKFSRILTESKDIYVKIHIRENPYICILLNKNNRYYTENN